MSLSDYNRVMLEYTQRQIAAFTNNDNAVERQDSAESVSSGLSSMTTVTRVARTGTGPAPQTSDCVQRAPSDVKRT